MAKLTNRLLERYYDGELSPRKARQVERLLEESEEHRGVLAKMSRMSDLLGLMNEENLDDVSFAGFGERVRVGIQAGQRPGVRERFKVWVTEFFEHRQVIWAPSLAVVTVAVALFIALPFVGPAEKTAPRATPGGGIWTAAAASKVDVGSTIVSVNFGETRGWKYDVSYAKGGTVGVVWIEDKP